MTDLAATTEPPAPPSLAAAQAREAAGDRAGADAIYAALYDQRAPDPALMLAWARLRRRAGDTDNAARMLDVAARAGAPKQAMIDMASMLIDQGQGERAGAILRQAATTGRSPALDYEVARWEAMHGRLPQAAALFRGITKAEPRHLGARLGLARSLAAMGQHAEAEGAYAALLKRDQNNIQIAAELANLYVNTRRFALALALYDRIAETGVDMVRELAQVLLAAMHTADWSLHDRLIPRISARMATGKPGMFDTLGLLASTDDPALHRQMAETFASALNILSEKTPRPAPRGVAPADRRLRIGYLCGDLNQGTIAMLAGGVLQAHDRGKFEIFAYDYSIDDQSPVRASLLQSFEHVVSLGSEPPPASAARIAADQIDILIDLKGYAERTRTEILALRPAPIQVSMLNYPATLGADWADYVIADAIVLPPALEQHFVEHAMRLPASYLPNDRSRPTPAPDSDRAAQGLPEHGIVFACFTFAYRITPDIFAAWMRILTQMPGSTLWLFEGNPAAGANLRSAAKNAGIDPARLVFARPATLEQHIARHACADLFLDTAPYGTHGTMADALWACLPAITIMGRSFAARTGASLLHATGLPELIAPDIAAYTDLALALAADPGRRAALRAQLLGARDSAPLFDAAAYARALERAYTEAADANRAGAPASAIDIEL
jgi:predicted O-linked N-acetylglucosamine transferase (SPINDLY family)